MEDSVSIQNQLAELRKSVEENTRILKTMRRNALIGSIVKTLIWLALIVGSYYLTMQFLEPYMSLLEGQRGQEGQDWQALLDQYRELVGQ